MEKILIFGISGFMGRHFARFITARGLNKEYAFYGADITEPNTATLSALAGFTKLDLGLPTAAAGLLEELRPEYIINLAAALKGDTPEQFLSINTELPLALMETIIRSGLKIKKLLLIGSSAEYGRNKQLPIPETAPLAPVNFYGLSKAAQSMYAEFYHRTFGLPVNVARTFNIIGHGISPELAIGAFLLKTDALPDGAALEVGDLDVSRDYLDVEDACAAYWAILLNGKPGEVYNVSSGNPASLREILDIIITLSGKKLKIKSTTAYKTDIAVSAGANKKLIADTGWKQTVALEESLKRATHKI